MKHFFYVVFGGMIAVLCGIVLVKTAVIGFGFVDNVRTSSGLGSLFSVATAIISQPTDGTIINGFKRSVRYSGIQEEDFFDAASLSLPRNSVAEITAKAYLVRNLSTDTTIIGYNNDRLMPLASLTKLVTAVVAKKNIKPDTKIEISKSIISTYGNTAQFKVGEAYKASDLLYPLLMVSSNDAAEAFAASYGRARFITAMNDWASSIGAYRTYFVDPSGLSPDNRATADDVSVILNWIRLNEPDLLAITQLQSKVIRNHKWINPTHFLSWSNYLGGKNGYTDEADRTTAVIFSLGPAKSVYSVILLGSSSRDQDVLKLVGKVR